MAAGVDVETLDGHVTIAEAVRYTIGNDGALLLLDEAGEQVARFEVGNWRNAALRGPWD